MAKLLALLAALPLALVLAIAVLASGPGGAPLPVVASAGATGEIPAELLGVYQDAAGRYCSGLPWTVLAGIGWMESRHGGGRADPATGEVDPPIVGVPIDGSPGLAAIADPTQPDGWARAMGPMQFLSTTWARWATLAPGRPAGAQPSPHNAWDAIHGAARLLCAGREHLDDVAEAVYAYNHSSDYVEAVLAKADTYAQAAPAAEAEPGSASGEAVVTEALRTLGVPYRWGGSDPATGLDCSGLVQWAYRQRGIEVPRTTADQINAGAAVEVSDLRPGDLIFTRGGRSGAVRDGGHVAIYAGGDMEIAAPYTGQVVTLRPIRPERIQEVRRIIGG
jgi:cell wall-associated NlpC family hydrolase